MDDATPARLSLSGAEVSVATEGAEVLAPRYTGLRGFNGRESPVLTLAVRGVAAAWRVCGWWGYEGLT